MLASRLRRRKYAYGVLRVRRDVNDISRRHADAARHVVEVSLGSARTQFRPDFSPYCLRNRNWALISMSVSITMAQDSWEEELHAQLALYGHRNWILVVDAAYPCQSNPAIQTLVTGGDHLDVVETVLEAVDQAAHVRAEVFLDKEIDFVPEEDARGIGPYRTSLYELLDGIPVSKSLHEDLIGEIDRAGDTFRILALKTELTLPYTSVFIRLDCGYWGAEEESKLRENLPVNDE